MIPHLYFLWMTLVVICQQVLCQELPKLNPLSLPGHLSINSRAKLLCVASSGEQPIDFNWLKDGQPVMFGKIEQLDEWTSSLTINPLSLSHIGNYTCKASNVAGHDQATAPLFVTAPPQWVMEPSDVKILTGRSVMLHCRAEGSPKVKITWRKISESQDSSTASEAADGFQVFENGTMMVTNAQKPRSGIYECDASNGVGNGLQKRVELTVYESPVVERVVDHVTVEKGSVAHLSCLAKGDPPLLFEWMKGTKVLNEWPQISERMSYSEVQSSKNIEFTVSVMNTDYDDEGLYTCIAKNDFGSDQKEIRLMLVERPHPPESVELVDIWSRSVRIKWDIPDNGNSPIMNYTVEYWSNPGGHWNVTLSSSSTSCILRNLRPYTQYSFHVWASNSIGNGQPSEQNQFTTAKEEPSAAPIDVKVEEIGSTFVRVSWKPPPREDWNGDLTGYYVGFKQSSSSLPFTFNTVELDENHSYYYMLRGLRRSTRYLVSVRAFNEVGSGPPSEEVSFKTHNKEALPQPTLLVQDIGSTYLQIKWLITDDSKPSTSGYTIHYRKSGNKWNEISVPDAFQNSYTLTNLDSGFPYQIYLTSHGNTGISEPSEIATVRTSPEAIFRETMPTSQPQPVVDEVTLILRIVIPVAVSTVIIVIVIVVACVYVYSKRPLPPPHLYGDLPASKNFSYMATAPRQRDVPIAICGGNTMKYGSPYSAVPLTRSYPSDEEPVYEVVPGDTLRKIRERSFDDEYRGPPATIV